MADGPAIAARVEVLAPLGGVDLGTFLDRPVAGAEPFAADRMEAVRALSASLAGPGRRDPGIAAAAFWLRKANLARLHAAHQARIAATPELRWVPAGRVFHVAPANVDALFLYSWAIAFLCGNASVVRLPAQRTAPVQAMLDGIDRTAGTHPAFQAENRFVSYGHDAEVSALFSAWCRHRIVWGGNATVAAMRAVPLNPHASERSFASKFSWALFKAGPYLAADAEARRRLAGSFFIDFFPFDQAACSTPQVLVWVGTEAEAEEASGRFLDALQAEAGRRGHMVDAGQAANRINAAFELALGPEVRIGFGRSALVSARLLDPADIRRDVCGGGFLRLARIPRAEDLAPLLDEGDQTVTHFGFSAAELRAFAPGFGIRGVDRLVPAGQALAFDPVWDGFDLVEDCLRRVTVRVRQDGSG